MDEATIMKLESRLRTSEEQIVHLQSRLTSLSKRTPLPLNDDEKKEADALKDANEKLRYQILHLKRSIIEEESSAISTSCADKEEEDIPKKKNKKEGKKEKGSAGGFASMKMAAAPAMPKVNMPPYVVDETPGPMVDIVDTLRDIFSIATTASYPLFKGEIILQSLAMSKANPQNADFQFNSCMKIPGTLKGTEGAPTSPAESAQRIIAHLPDSAVIERVVLDRGGFILIFLNKEFLKRRLELLVSGGVQPPIVKKRTVALDLSSPNIAKEMHVGHLRSTIIGDSIGRILEFLGHKVHRINHVGDWGTQFGMLITHLQDQFPNFATESPPIGDLQAFYKESKKRFDVEEDFKARAYENVVGLQQGNPIVRRAWQLICDVSRVEFNKIYTRLDIELTERGESFYQDRMEGVVEGLVASGAAVEEDGRLVVKVDGHEVPMTVRKSDGGFTYDTSDLAALKHRTNELFADWLIYVVDKGQSLHFQLLFDASVKAGYCTPGETRLDHTYFGVVLSAITDPDTGKVKREKFKTRSGDTVRLSDLLDEAARRTEAVLRERPDNKMTEEEILETAEIVAMSAVKYADLHLARTSDYVFNYDDMLSLKGDTAVYLLYQKTRISSIQSKIGISYADLCAKDNGRVVLEHPTELVLAKHLLTFPSVMASVQQTLMPNEICSYLYTLCEVFSKFYTACRCTEFNMEGDLISINESRLRLCAATDMILSKGFDLLGMKSVKKM